MKKFIFPLMLILVSCTCLPQIPPQYLYADENCEAFLPNYLPAVSVLDNCEGAVLTQEPLSGTVLDAANPYVQVKITATDISGNTDIERFDVLLVDTIPPEIIIDTALLNSWIPPISNDSMILVTITGPGNKGSWGVFTKPGTNVIIGKAEGFEPIPEPVLTPLTLDAGINDGEFCKQESGTVHYNYAFTPGLATMYKSERNGDFIYKIPTGIGNFKIELHFAEIDWNEIGKRIFDVWIEDNKVLNDFDIMKEVDAKKALIKSFNTNVIDGWLDVKFYSEIDNAKISGIIINKI